MLFNSTRFPFAGRSSFALIPSVAVLLAASAPAQAGETIVYSFCSQSSCSDGVYPAASLVADQQGALYGTNFRGTPNDGAVFKLTPPGGAPPWSESVLYSFKGGTTDGQAPEAGLIVGEKGALYSATSAGGSQNCYLGCGTVFWQCSLEGGEVFGGKTNLRCLRW